ncbi:subtilisin-like protease SBT5.3 [Brachypodium distachyon]|uniref:Subtilisin-like protease n=1 Tax=Brachypodium distachyon TaxID=15368 RepID=A0A0Q3F551_BRADI|nr:subtilisin-like protease SBT5.3 [Brachypodium distachyon]KQJ93460.1 hypothetical protein BRADI_3g04690v3 [Brachypodium distachyon]|eukprot:XP_003570964.1 subtilisin-like protease SBT5.3 [Brachypodium distachyon]
MGRGSGRVLLLLALALFLTLQITPASAVPKGYCVFFDDLASSSSLLNGLTQVYSVLYRLDAISAIGLLIEETLVPDLLKLDRVVAVIPDKLYKPQTTHSWEFLGLESGGKRNPEWEQATKYGQGVIIANVDTGVSPTSASFRNDGLMVDPSKWRHRDTCDAGNDPTFQCNNKLIGARFFSKAVQVESLHHGNSSRLNRTDLNSPRDHDGHGTHTLSTAGGGFVDGAGAFGHGAGTAKGGSPRARVASYKACFLPNACSGIDILKAVVTAVDDGVDVLSLSLGEPPAHYITGLMELGALYAVRKGVVVVAAAGNDGPEPGSVTNVAPWMFTVGASTMDRDFPALVTFRVTTTNTTKTIKGRSLSDSTVPAGQEHPMISGEKASATESTKNSTLCLPGSLDQAKVKGKIVVCTRGVNGRMQKGQVVKEAGGIGMVLCNDESSGDSTDADPHVIPAAHCSFSQCKDLLTYLQSESPVGDITAMDAELGVKPAPVMAAFSSRGPNTITPQILKPDITAPGVGVIAAYGELEATATDLPSYNILSGTSMACPHVAGIAGLLKTKYPEWSPAMIKSAIMTTADNYSQIQEETGAAATPLGFGAGHVNPLKALDPGLVYDTTLGEYASFLCATSTKPSQAQTLTGILGLAAGGLLRLPFPLFSRLLSLLLDISPFQCSSSFRPEDLNYPSIAAVCLSPGTPVTVKRRVKNVLDATTTTPRLYAVAVVPPAGIKVTVEPGTLSFGEMYEEKVFSVKMEVYDAALAADYVFGSIEWSDSDGKHRVRSPVAATTKCA